MAFWNRKKGNGDPSDARQQLLRSYVDQIGYYDGSSRSKQLADSEFNRYRKAFNLDGAFSMEHRCEWIYYELIEARDLPIPLAAIFSIVSNILFSDTGMNQSVTSYRSSDSGKTLADEFTSAFPEYLAFFKKDYSEYYDLCHAGFYQIEQIDEICNAFMMHSCILFVRRFIKGEL